MSIVDEKAFESFICEELVSHGGYAKAKAGGHDFDPVLGLDTHELMRFIRATQVQEWRELEHRHGSAAKAQASFLTRLTQALDRDGTVQVLRHGVSDLGVPIRLAYFRPAHSLTPALQERYAANRLTVTRQLPFQAGSHKTLDLCLFVNGIPVATAELKNHLTGQTVDDARQQYRRDRDPANVTLRRAVVHFAADTDSVLMTTRLAGEHTVFLPFNRGHDLGAGNPPNPGGHRTAYLWRQVWQRDAWLDLLARFVHTEAAPAGTRGPGRVIFPRYHQWDAVRRLEAHAREHGAGQHYLVQHSAGSGKSNTIAWLAHRLSVLHGADDRPVFDKVIVITDRVVLDSQLQATVFQFEHVHGVVERIDRDSAQLAAALQGRTARIVITTLQKFPFVLERGVELPDRRYAVIVDEAHSSQGGEAAKDLNRLLGGGAGDDDAAVLAAAEAAEAGVSHDAVSPAQDALAAQVTARGRQANVSMFAFTATPKGRTLELFGTRNPASERYEPFHLYAMKQAIEEGFILDVLANYTTYRAFWHIEKAVADDPQYASRAAKRAIARFVDLHPSNLAQKAEVITEHFREHVAHRIGGRAKAMVVTASRLHAVRYARALRAYADQRGYPLGVLCAFSGTVDDGGVPVTEAQMNGVPESQTAAEFAGSAFQVLVVAEKFQTGFDQPLLYAMYVDKTLSGISAVQTLSRLNRIHDGKDGTFVLDFRNDAEDIRAAFEEYHGLTAATPSDPNLLWDTRGRLDGWDVLRREEIDAFAAVLLGEGGGLTDSERSGRVQGLLDPAVDRFRALDDDDDQDAFRDALGRFVQVYGFISQIISYGETAMEADYLFCRHLASKIRRTGGTALDLSDEVELTHLRHERTFTGAVALTATDGELTTFFGDGSGGQQDVTESLGAIVGRLNEQFSLGITDADAIPALMQRVADDLTASRLVQQEAVANDLAAFAVGKARMFEDGVIDRMDAENEAALALLNRPEVLAALARELTPFVHTGARVRGQQAAEIGTLLMPGLAGDHLVHLPGIRTGDPAATGGLVPEDALVATVAAMANGKPGGTVLIGVDPDGQVTGLEADYASFPGTGPDDFPAVWQAWLAELLATRLGAPAAGLVDAEVHTVAGQDLCRLSVRPSPVPVDDRGPAGRVLWWRAPGRPVRPVCDDAERDRLVGWRWGS